MAWRFTATIPGLDSVPDAIAGWVFAVIEATTLVSSTIAMFIMSRTTSRSAEADAHLQWWTPDRPPVVDILIATYNEEEPILERTVAGALGCNYC